MAEIPDIHSEGYPDPKRAPLGGWCDFCRHPNFYHVGEKDQSEGRTVTECQFCDCVHEYTFRQYRRTA